MDELKPCPFCGGKASLHGSGTVWWVNCHNCTAEMNVSDSKEGSITAWNERQFFANTAYATIFPDGIITNNVNYATASSEYYCLKKGRSCPDCDSFGNCKRTAPCNFLQIYTVNQIYHQPTEDEVAEIDRALADLVLIQYEFNLEIKKMQYAPFADYDDIELLRTHIDNIAFAITALRKMKGE